MFRTQETGSGQKRSKGKGVNTQGHACAGPKPAARVDLQNNRLLGRSLCRVTTDPAGNLVQQTH